MKIHGSHTQFSTENALDSQIKIFFLITRKKIIQQNQTIASNKVITESEGNRVRRIQISKRMIRR